MDISPPFFVAFDANFSDINSNNINLCPFRCLLFAHFLPSSENPQTERSLLSAVDVVLMAIIRICERTNTLSWWWFMKSFCPSSITQFASCLVAWRVNGSESCSKIEGIFWSRFLARYTCIDDRHHAVSIICIQLTVIETLASKLFPTLSPHRAQRIQSLSWCYVFTPNT